MQDPVPAHAAREQRPKALPVKTDGKQARPVTKAQLYNHKADKEGREYHKPWQQNMRKPGSLHTPLNHIRADNDENEGFNVSMMAIPEVELVLEEGPLGPAAGRSISPGPAHKGGIDPAAHQQLKVSAAV